MVSVVGEFLLADALARLEREVRGIPAHDGLARAFAMWLGLSVIPAIEAQEFNRRRGAARSYQDVAVLSYLAAAGLAADFETDLRSGLQWLVGRAEKVGGIPAPFTSDGLAALGIALGGARLGGEVGLSVADWMTGFTRDSVENAALDTTTRDFFAAAGCVLGLDVPRDLPAEMTIVLQDHGWPCAAVSESETEAMLRGLRNESGTLPSYVSALRLAALRLVYAASPVAVPGRVSAEEIGNILRRVPHAMLHWTWESKARTKNSDARKWVIEHEYHVQNLLWAVLAPLLPDLTAEEYTPPVGSKQARADLGVPSLRLIIEVKYMYPSTTTQKMIEQVAADAGLYLTDQSRYDEMVAFVWDSRGKTEEHQILVDGLKGIRGVVDAIVVARPGVMNG